MTKLEATVTYSKDGHKKKQRRWFDGTLKFDLTTRFATLFAEDGKFVASGTIPADVEIQDDSEEFILEAPSILVVISTITSGNSNAESLPPQPAANVTARQPAAGAALRRSFAPPLLPAPPAAISNTHQRPLHYPQVFRQQQEQQPSPSLDPPPAMQHQQRPPVIKRPERSTQDILRLLGGNVENLKDSPPPSHNPAKKQRILSSSEELAQPPQPLQPSSSMQPQFNSKHPQANGINNNSTRVPQQYNSAQLPPRAPPRAAPSAVQMPPKLPPQPLAPAPSRTSFAPVVNDSLPAATATAAGKWNPRLNNNNSSTSVVPVQSTAGNARPSFTAQRPQVAASVPGTVYFPNAQESSKPARRVVIPDRFSTPDAYLNSWEDSLYEEMTLKLADVAKDFHTAAAGVGGAGAGASSSSASSSAALEAAMRKARVPYYSTCELFIWKNYPGKQNGGNFSGGRKKKKKDSDSGYDDEGPSDSASKPENVYLILKSGRVKNVDYSKGDLWILSNHPLMKSGFDPGQPGDRTKVPWVAVARSLWFGPNQDGKFEVEFLSSKPSTLGRSTPVYAIKGPNASMELNILDLLKSPSLAALPLLRCILGAVPLAHNLIAPCTAPGHTEAKTPTNSVADDEEQEDQEDEDELLKTPAELADAVIRKFKLNSEQATVVRHVATWAMNNNTSTESSSAPPVCLIFGPFGCGKSSLLIAVLHLLLKLRKRAAVAAPALEGNAGNNENNEHAPPKNPLFESRILISAHTNVAVDRVLTGLLESGCSDFLRVGPLRRIDRSLLPYSLHASESKSHANATAELKDMLCEGEGKMSPTEEAALRAELAAMAAGAERKRKKLLKTAPIVGVTCCSSLLPVLENLAFDVVILDECSQIIEPLAMAPILRAKAKFLIAAGDPRQLPPVIANPPSLAIQPSSSSLNTHTSASKSGLLRPLFVRLSDLGATPHLLRQQYRCHPALSAIPNAQFYQGKLLDGCTAEQRPSLIPGLPPAVFVDVRDGRETFVYRSTANSTEAHSVVRVVEKALAAGVDPARMGVICFYRAQVQEVLNVLHSRASFLQAAVEKAKQKQALQDQHENENLENLVAEEDEDKETPKKSHLESNASTYFTSIQVATVDAFQGAEKDIIVLTSATTRAGAFIADAARLNVALTRAKHNLVVVGCGQALDRTAPAFSALIHAAKTTPGGYHVGNIF